MAAVRPLALAGAGARLAPVIVVIGSAAYRAEPAAAGRAVGLAPDIAAAAAAAGASVELLARIGEDGAGEELLLAIARSGVGHLAVLRDPARPTALAPVMESVDDDDEAPPALLAEAEEAATRTMNGFAHGPGAVAPGPVLEPADLSLGLRYLREFRVVVAIEPIADDGAAVIADAAAFADAALVVVASQGFRAPSAYAAATILEAPAEDPEGAFARLVGGYAAALDRGVPAGEAFQAAAESGGWEVAAG
jgi:hypothetical protein